jgi:hypothetical protein
MFRLAAIVKKLRVSVTPLSDIAETSDALAATTTVMIHFGGP